MANISKINRRRKKEIENAAKNRREIIAAQLSRREMMRMGLLTSAGFLIPKKGLSSRPLTSAGFDADICTSPPTRAFIEPFTRMQVKQPVASLTPAPTVCPNTAAGESRTRCHQAFTQLPPQKLYQVSQQAAQVRMHQDLPLQTLWTFDGISPGPLYIANYGEPILVRNFNNLPVDNGGFGKNEVST